jgi:hypothetical protein
LGNGRPDPDDAPMMRFDIDVQFMQSYVPDHGSDYIRIHRDHRGTLSTVVLRLGDTLTVISRNASAPRILLSTSGAQWSLDAHAGRNCVSFPGTTVWSIALPDDASGLDFSDVEPVWNEPAFVFPAQNSTPQFKVPTEEVPQAIRYLYDLYL